MSVAHVTLHAEGRKLRRPQKTERCVCGRRLWRCRRQMVLPHLFVLAERPTTVQRKWRTKKLSRAYLKRLVRQYREVGEFFDGDGLVVPRPRTRADCAGGPRPCPWVSCRFHLFLEVLEDGGIKLNHPHLAGPEEMTGPSCALDVAEEHNKGMYLHDVGDLLGISRERARLLEADALAKLRATLEEMGMQNVGEALKGLLTREEER